ncbi:hypothetical protein [Gordonia sp. FQ]|uniref:hypothetical protein n=1 Tax=Gordonia sp. FQ TaxID=3446634 RepID=UPI003F82F3B2
MTTITIAGSVGRGGKNFPADVESIGAALAEIGPDRGGAAEQPSTPDELIAAIERFQELQDLPVADGRVDPGGATLAKIGAVIDATGQPPVPLVAGDHLWYYDGQGNDRAIAGPQVCTARNIPRRTWFPTSNPGDRNDYCDNGKHIFNVVLYDTELRMGQPQLLGGKGTYAWLNNNPGNLTSDGGSYDQFPGKLNWHDFMIFPDHDTGFAAIRPWLQRNGYLPRTIEATFQKYAPHGDGRNSPEQYAADVAAAAGVPASTVLADLSDDQWQCLLNGIERVEGTVEGTRFTYDDPDIPALIAQVALEV